MKKEEYKGYYTFQFSYLGNNGEEIYEVVNINDPMNVENAVKMAYRHAREYSKGRVNRFASNSLLNQVQEEILKKIEKLPDVEVEWKKEGIQSTKIVLKAKFTKDILKLIKQ